MQDFDFLSPKTLFDLTEMIADTSGCILAGGTDLIPKMKRSAFSPKVIIDISKLDELRFIHDDCDQTSIGAMTTHQEIAESAHIAQVNPALKEAVLTVGCEQTRNRGTLGGNIANASPAADTIPPLLIFDSNIHLKGKFGERTFALDEFLVSSGITKIRPYEYIHSISFKPLNGAWGAAFLKLGKRNGMAISVVNAAAAVVVDPDRKITKARLSIGSAAPRVIRSRRVEDILIGEFPTPEIIDQASKACLEDIEPISDVRSSAAYRFQSAEILSRRVLNKAISQALGRLS